MARVGVSHTANTTDNTTGRIIMNMLTCRSCGEDTLHPERYNIGYNYCMDCGDFRAREERAGWCIAPIAHKQGATLVTNRNDLKGLNKYVGE